MATAAFAWQFGTAVLFLLLGFFAGRAEEEKALHLRRFVFVVGIVLTAVFLGLLCARAALRPQYLARMTMFFYQTNPQAARQRATQNARHILRLLDNRESIEDLQRHMKTEAMPKWGMIKVEVAPEPRQCEFYGDRVASEIQSAYALAVLKADPKLPARLTGRASKAAERPLVILEPPRTQPVASAIVGAGVPATGRATLAAILFLLGFGASGILAQRRTPK